MAKSRIIVSVDAPSDDPFDSTKRRSLAQFSGNLASCSWKYRPTDGGMVDAKVEVIAKRGTELRDRLESGHLGLVTIYRGNHKTELPVSSGYVQSYVDFETNERSYLLFQGVADNPEVDSTSDLVTFSVRGLGKWLEDVEYTGSFIDKSIGEVFTTVMTEVIARSNQPFKAFALPSLTVTGGVPDSHHVLHRTLVGLREYKDASLANILKDLQEAAGGKASVTWGARCRNTSSEFAEVYLLPWSSNTWSPEYQADESALEDAPHIAKSRTVEYLWTVDTSSIKNSVTVYGAKTSDGMNNVFGASEVGLSIREHGRRHATVVNDSLPTEEACLEYAAAWLQENSARKITVDLEWLDEQTMKDSRRSGGETNAKPRDVVHYLRDMTSPLHLLQAGRKAMTVKGLASSYAGINATPAAVKLSQVASGDAPHIRIDTTAAPFYEGNWSSSTEFAHPNREITYGEFSTTRAMLWSVRYGITDPTASLDGRVLVEWSKKIRLRITQSGGAGTNYGFTIESYRGTTTGWVDEFASAEEGSPFGHGEYLPNTHGSTSGGACVALEIRGNVSAYPWVSMWSDSVAPWRTLTFSVNEAGTTWGASTTHLRYLDLAYNQLDDYILIGCGTQTDGSTTDPATSGNWEIYSARCDEGVKPTTLTAPTYAQGLNAEGVTDTSTTPDTFDADKSFLALAHFTHIPKAMFDGSCIMFLDPVIDASVVSADGSTTSEKYFVRWSRGAIGTYDGQENDGFHAELVDPQSGDGLVIGTSTTTAADAEDSVGQRSRHWRLGASGDYRRRLGDGVTVYPYSVEFDFNGEHSPLGIKVKGGTSADTLTGSTETLLARLEQAERGTTESL